MYRKKYLIDYEQYEQTGGAFGKLTIITSNGKRIKGVLDNNEIKRLTNLNKMMTIYFEKDGIKYEITKPDKYYQITSHNDRQVEQTNYTFEFAEYQTVAININGSYYKTMWINNNDYYNIMSLTVLDVIIDPLTDSEQTIKIYIKCLLTETNKKTFKIINSNFIRYTSTNNYTFIIKI